MKDLHKTCLGSILAVTLIVLSGCGGGDAELDSAIASTTSPVPNASLPAALAQLSMPETATTQAVSRNVQQSVSRGTTNQPTTPTADEMMFYVERTYPALYIPQYANVNPVIQADGFVFKYFGRTQSYIGVKTNGEIYTLGPDGVLKFFGYSDDFTCQVKPEVCVKPILTKVTADPMVPVYAYMAPTRVLTVKVVDSTGKGMYGQIVTWTTTGNGWVIPIIANQKTGGDGALSVSWVYGDAATQTLTATVTNLRGDKSTLTYYGQVKPFTAIDWSTTPGSSLLYGWRDQGTTGISGELTPLDEAPQSYFAMNWQDGYTGIQRGGSHFDRQLQFSVWNVNGIKSSVVNPGRSTCQDFGNEGFGVACWSQYTWSVNKTYRFEMTTANVVAGYVDITVNFIEVATGTRLYLGTLRQAQSDNRITSGVIYFVEDFNRNYLGCATVPEKSVRTSTPKVLTAAGSWVSPTLHSKSVYAPDITKVCSNSGYIKNTDGSVTIGLGGTAKFKTGFTASGWNSIL